MIATGPICDVMICLGASGEARLYPHDTAACVSQTNRRPLQFLTGLRDCQRDRIAVFLNRHDIPGKKRRGRISAMEELVTKAINSPIRDIGKLTSRSTSADAAAYLTGQDRDLLEQIATDGDLPALRDLVHAVRKFRKELTGCLLPLI